MISRTKIAILAGALAAACSANAVTLQFNWNGTYLQTGSTEQIQATDLLDTGEGNNNGNTYVESFDNLGDYDVTSITYSYTHGAAGTTFTDGTGSLFGASIGLLSFTFSGTNTASGMTADSVTFSPILAGPLKGLGAANSTFSHTDHAYDSTYGISDSAAGQFTVDFEAVPEPTTLAAFGIGLVGLARRRARKA